MCVIKLVIAATFPNPIRQNWAKLIRLPANKVIHRTIVFRIFTNTISYPTSFISKIANYGVIWLVCLQCGGMTHVSFSKKI